MKKHFLLLTLLIVAIAVSAAPVDPIRALQTAQEFVPTQVKVKKNAKGKTVVQPSEIVYTHYMPKSGKPAIYVVNIGDAFAIVSADDVAHPILGYNYSKSWPKDDNLPPQVKSFFDDLAQQMEAASEHPQDAKTAAEWRSPRKAPQRAQTNENLPDSVGPLLTTTWDQGQYYNSLCPEDGQSPNGHVPTGCVATAMAQIINYWGQKETIKTRGKHSYESNYGTLEVDFENTIYDFAHMPNALTSASTLEEVNAIAKLIFNCGVAVNMGYGISESSAFDQEARAALINFFRFSPDLSFAEKAYFSDEEWSNMLKRDIASGKPVYYSGRNDNNAGHAFVCNGYQKDGYFYFNFGWSGLADGWYLTNAVLGYTSNQAAILGIIPDATGNVILGQMQGTSTFTVDDEPLEFYHLMGHNKYSGSNYNNSCSNIIVFTSSDNSKQLVTDIIEFEDQNITIYDGLEGGELRTIIAGAENDLAPIVSTTDKIKLTYHGYLYNAGFHLAISQNSNCRKVSNISTSVYATTVHLMWTENASATQWEVEYGVAGFKLGNGSKYLANTNTATFTDLQKFTEYDFYIRSVCGDDQYGSWNKTTIMVEAPYWQDIVNKQPTGYEIAPNGTILISTPEGLAWWAKNPSYTSIKLLADLDMSAYNWKPIPMPAQNFEMDGDGHSINNLYIHEHSNAAFFEWTVYCIIKNLHIKQATVIGTGSTAILFGQSSGYNTILNTAIDGGIVKGTDMVGSFAGMTYSSSYTNCYVKDVSMEANCSCGLFAGVGGGDFHNCYAHGRATMHMNCYNAGILADTNHGSVKRSYSVDM